MFLSALASEPNHTMARYNLACALAATGELERAKEEFLRVLRSDLPQFRGRVTTDADIEPLRESAHWAEIEQVVSELDIAWHAAASTLLPVVALPKAERTSAEAFPQSKAVPYARAGVYSTDGQRFVPLGQPLERALGVSTTTHNEQVLGFTGEGGLDVEGTLQQLREHRVDSFGSAQPRIAKATDALWFMADAPLDGADAVFHDYRSELASPARKALRITAYGATFVRDFSEPVVQAAILRLPEQTRAQYATTIEGSELEGDTLNLFRDWERLPHGVLLFTISGHCRATDVTMTHAHFLHFVSDSGESRTLIDAAKGGGAIRLAGDIVMVQSGGQTLLLNAKNPNLAAAGKLPSGLYLTIPFTAHGCTRGI